ncbi:MAG: SoxR reducing system RseC family protein [Clostridia bacterium]|nr:SoxR reducing system RseC family protein [Clostridia bacterium]
MQRCGEVIGIEGNSATVRVKMANSCSPECENYGICKKHEEDIVAINSVGAKVGDRVKLETPDGPLLLYAFITFIIPLFLCLLLAGAAWCITESAIAAMIGGAVGLALSAVVVFKTDRKLKKTEKPSVITEIEE